MPSRIAASQLRQKADLLALLAQQLPVDRQETLRLPESGRVLIRETALPIIHIKAPKNRSLVQGSGQLTKVASLA